MRGLREKSREAAVLTALIMCMALIIAMIDVRIIKRQQYTELEWEDANIEEIQTVVQETEQAKDIPVDAVVQECTQETIRKEVNEFTYEESQLMMYVTQAEAGNQGADGMWLVLSVILNRVKDPDWPDNIEDVIYQKYAFSSVLDGRINEVELSPEVHEALARIESGDVCPEIIGFEVKTSNELDKYFKIAFEYKDHRFYTKK